MLGLAGVKAVLSVPYSMLVDTLLSEKNQMVAEELVRLLTVISLNCTVASREVCKLRNTETKMINLKIVLIFSPPYLSTSILRTSSIDPVDKR